MRTHGVVFAALILLFSPGAVLADTVIVSSVQSGTGTQSLSVTNMNGVATAIVNGVRVTLPYNQNGTTIRIISGGQLGLSLRSPLWNALGLGQGNRSDRHIESAPLMPGLSNP